jgi:hypothetical protein
MINNKTLVIIAGAAGEIGIEFCKGLAIKGVDCIAVIRNKQLSVDFPSIQSVSCNLDNQYEIEEKFLQVKFENYNHVIFLHTIGVDKFDPRGYPNIKPMDTIDSDIYNTNVNSFKYLFRYCARRIRNINLYSGKEIKFKTAIIAGVADKHTPFVIESFCEVKFILRQYIQSIVQLYPEWASGLSINITSTVTESALKVRPYADTTYWLTAEDVVNKSIDELLVDTGGYKELDLIKSSPYFTSDYYENDEVLYQKWSKETGIQ